MVGLDESFWSLSNQLVIAYLNGQKYIQLLSSTQSRHPSPLSLTSAPPSHQAHFSRGTTKSIEMPPGKPPTHLTPTKHGDIYDAISPLKALHGSAKGLSVLITGSGRGIGRAQALLFAQAGAAKITLVSLEEKELEEVQRNIASLGYMGVNIVAADVTSEEQVANAFDGAGSVDGRHSFARNETLFRTISTDVLSPRTYSSHQQCRSNER